MIKKSGDFYILRLIFADLGTICTYLLVSLFCSFFDLSFLKIVILTCVMSLSTCSLVVSLVSPVAAGPLSVVVEHHVTLFVDLSVGL